jgi:hypothetical protein
MAYTTTTKWALRKLTGASLVSDIDAGFTALADDIDLKLTPYDSGMASARPTSSVVSPGKAGRNYRPTDAAGVDLDTGTSWLRMAPLPPTVTSLPASPVDGQEIYFVADSANGAVWHLRYRAASSSPYKWEFLGGAGLHTEAFGSGSITPANGFTSSLSSNTLSGMTLPLAGDYDATITYGYMGSDTAGGFVEMGITWSGASPSAADCASAYISTAGTGYPGSMHRRVTGRAAASQIFPVYHVSLGTATFTRGTLRVAPVRVG